MATPRSNIVKLRLTDLEKKDWQEAAGGARKLSEWIRGVCNAAAQPIVRPGMTDLMVSPESIDAALAADPTLQLAPGIIIEVDNLKPKIVSDAIERAVAQLPQSKLGEAPKGETCDRWMHHRPGVYCGSCKQVVKK